MEKKKKRRRHRGLGFLILVMGVLIVCGVYQYREYGNIKDVMLKLIGQDPVIYQHVSEEIGEMDGKFYYLAARCASCNCVTYFYCAPPQS